MAVNARKMNLKILSVALSLLLLLLVIPSQVFAQEVNPFTEKWGSNLYTYPGYQPDFTTLVMPLTADVIGDSWHEIFLSLGFDHSMGDEGMVFCLDGHTGDVIWSYSSDNFGSHTCLELYDLDSDGNLELLATGYHHVVAFHAENGDVLWEFTRMGNRQDKPAVILEENDEVYVFTASHQGSNGIGLQKRLGSTGELLVEVSGPLHPCHGGLSCEDLDGDGEYELLVTDRDFGVGHRGIQCYDTDLNLLWSQSSVQCSSHLPNIIDVNNDEILDVVVMNQGDGSAGICIVDGSDGSKMTGKWDENLGLYAHYTPTIYDIDQDGNLELITAREMGGGPPTSVWDLETWSLDAELWRRDGPYSLCKPPQIANVIGDSDMEMVFVTHAGFEMYDKNYELAAYHNDGLDGRSDRIVIQDIDNDGLNEIIAIMHEPGTTSLSYSYIQCLDTPGTAPTPRARSTNFLYSLRRNGVSTYVEPLQQEENIPPVAQDDSYSIEENNQLTVEVPGILSNDVDTDGPDELSAVLVADVSNGSLDLDSDGSFIYIPDTDYNGIDQFSYYAWDGEYESNAADVIITVYPMADTTSPEITNIIFEQSDPADTQIGWNSITCTVTDDTEVEEVILNLTYPDFTQQSFSMIRIGDTDRFFYTTICSLSGNYSYIISATDTNENTALSGSNHFALPANWDVDLDGECTSLDQALVFSYYGNAGDAGWIRADVDNNGEIGVFDLVLLSNHFGEIWWTEQESYSTIQKLSIAYTSSINEPENQQFIAEHFDMLDCGKSVLTASSNIKSLNPEIEILGYYDSIIMQSYYGDWDYVNQFEEWFVHDYLGNRVELLAFDGYLMNPAPNLTPDEEYTSWNEYYSQRSAQFLQDNSQYNGIFVDDCAYDLQDAGYSFNVPYDDFEDGILENWDIWMMDLVQNLQNVIGSNMVMPNAWKYTEFCEEITGMHVWENFVHGKVHDITNTGYNEWYTMHAVDTLKEMAELGHSIAAISGTKNADSNPDLAHQYMLFTMICFLFAVEDMDTSYFAWNFFSDDASHGYYEDMDYEFGDPEGDYYNIQGSVYARQFENALVVANINPSASDSVYINGQWYDIEPRSGLII